VTPIALSVNGRKIQVLVERAPILPISCASIAA